MTEGRARDLIPLLQAAQEAFGYIPERAMESIAGLTGIPVSEIYGVVTFYKQFRLTRRGKYMLKLCDGTACHVNGSTDLEIAVEDALKIRRGQTDPDLLFTLEVVNCVGCCSLAPVLMVEDETHGTLNPRKVTTLLKKLRTEAKSS
ncbi:MAG: NAD(P)H-dependent oxidoreductase subunit E [Deltaproteobacteria bacterium]|nr:NAD(P)H-dependent oxidoreductase subunit E [Deltaproteobacteria bacterium]